MELSIDREKVIKWLEVCLKNIDQQDCPNDCPYLSDCSKYENRVIFQPIMRDALALLKEQEAKPMTEYDDGWDCPRCGLKLVGKTASGYPCDEFDLPNDEIVKYCPVCGQAVKWE